jgi:death-on-curing protein
MSLEGQFFMSPDSIVRNHPFVDGNKRVAFMAAYVFLACNVLRLEAPEADATQAVLALAAGELPEERFADWLRDHCERRTGVDLAG